MWKSYPQNEQRGTGNKGSGNGERGTGNDRDSGFGIRDSAKDSGREPGTGETANAKRRGPAFVPASRNYGGQAVAHVPLGPFRPASGPYWLK